MAGFHPKEILRLAREAERAGQARIASHHYAMLAVFLRRKEKYDEAKQLLERAIALSPQSARLYLQMALCEVSLGRNQEAKSAMTLFSHYALERKKAEIYTPYLSLHLKNYPKLRRIFFEAVLTYDWTCAFPFLGVANAYLQEKNFNESLKSLIQAWRTKDRLPEVASGMGDVFKRQRNAAGLSDVNRLEQHEITIDEFEMKWALEAKGVRSQEVRLSSSPAAPEKSLQTLIQELESSLGFELEDKRDSVAPLIKEFRRKTDSIVGTDSVARIDLAMAFYEMALFADARDELSRISEVDKKYVEAQCLLGEILIAEGAELAATEVFQRLLRDPRIEGDALLHCQYQLALLSIKMGSWGTAKELVAAIEKNNPHYRHLRHLKTQLESFLEEDRVKKAS